MVACAALCCVLGSVCMRYYPAELGLVLYHAISLRYCAALRSIRLDTTMRECAFGLGVCVCVCVNVYMYSVCV